MGEGGSSSITPFDAGYGFSFVFGDGFEAETGIYDCGESCSQHLEATTTESEMPDALSLLGHHCSD